MESVTQNGKFRKCFSFSRRYQRDDLIIICQCLHVPDLCLVQGNWKLYHWKLWMESFQCSVIEDDCRKRSEGFDVSECPAEVCSRPAFVMAFLCDIKRSVGRQSIKRVVLFLFFFLFFPFFKKIGNCCKWFWYRMHNWQPVERKVGEEIGI